MTSRKQTHRKEKPWDTDDIDKWKIVEYDAQGPSFLAKSSFSCLFPKYRQDYIKECWSFVTSTLAKVGIECELDLVKGSMTVSTTEKTVDPFILFKARDVIRLLARSVPYQQSLKVLEDDINCDIIKIGNQVRNKERFIKRRQRLLGPNGNTLKALELLTECYIMVQGNTVSVLGPFKGLKQVRNIVLDCMKNIHPIYHIKELMIKKELQKDETLKNENWDRFLPKFKKNSSKPVKKAPVQKKEKQLFPPAQTPRKVDLQMESGEYFLSKTQLVQQKSELKLEKQRLNSLARKESRLQDFVPLPEPKRMRVMKESDGNEKSTGAGIKPVIKKKQDDFELIQQHVL